MLMWRISIGLGVAWMLILVWFVFIAKAEGPSRGPDGHVTWDANTEIDLEGYRAYFGQTPGAVAHVVEVKAPDHALAYGTVSLTPGQWYVAVSAFDLSGNESERAGPLPFVYDPVAPSLPLRLSLPEIKRGLQDICVALGLTPEACHVDIQATVTIP